MCAKRVRRRPRPCAKVPSSAIIDLESMLSASARMSVGEADGGADAGVERSANRLERTRRSWDLLHDASRLPHWPVGPVSAPPPSAEDENQAVGFGAQLNSQHGHLRSAVAAMSHRRSSSVDPSPNMRRRRGVHGQPVTHRRSEVAASPSRMDEEGEDEYFSDSYSFAHPGGHGGAGMDCEYRRSSAVSVSSEEGSAAEEAAMEASGMKRIRETEKVSMAIVNGTVTEGGRSMYCRRIKQQRLDSAAIGRLAASVQSVSMRDGCPPGAWVASSGAPYEGSGSSTGFRVMVDELQAMHGDCGGGKLCTGEAMNCSENMGVTEDASKSIDSESDDEGSGGGSGQGDVDAWLHGTTDWWTH